MQTKAPAGPAGGDRATGPGVVANSDAGRLAGATDVDEGTGAAEVAGAARITLTVGGMTCASCANRVERKLNRLDGVRASVNYATGRATIDAAGVGEADLIDSVEKAGYRAEPFDRAAAHAPADNRDERRLWRRLIVAIVLFIPLSDMAILFAISSGARFPGWQLVLTVVTLPVVVWCAAPFHRSAWDAAKHRLGTMDTLVSLGVIVSTLWSLVTIYLRPGVVVDDSWWDALRSSGSIYLETAAGITVFVLAGRFFEAKARRSSAGALTALAALSATEATVVLRDGSELRIPADELTVGQRFVTRSGDRVATDAVVERGDGSVDTSAMTGESAPTHAGPGDRVVGGTTLASGHLVSTVTAVGADTALAEMVTLVESAQSEKAATQRIADRISAVFVPVVVVIAAATLTGWLALGGSADHAIDAALAVLVIACPCALGLATPTALLVASGRAAQLGTFITGHRSLEATQDVSTVVLDKTGTITAGALGVQRIVPVDLGVDQRWLALAGALEGASGHPVAVPVARVARRQCGALGEVTDFADEPGRGVRGTVGARVVVAGSARWLSELDISFPAALDDERIAWEHTGGVAVLVAVDGEAAGMLLLADAIRPTAAPAVARLRARGLDPVLLTGDSESAARRVADEVGIDRVIAEVLPADKAAVVAELQSAGERVAFVGDGINDGPALARADLGMAIGQGTDVAIQAADMILSRSELTAADDAIALSSAALRTIRWNFVWALGYNVAAIPVAAAGLANPLLASAAMALSSLFVVSNSLRLQRFRPGGGSVARG